MDVDLSRLIGFTNTII